MKSMIKYSLLFMVFVVTLLTVIDINEVTTRKAEIEEATSISMRDALKGSNVNKIYEMTDEDINIEFIRQFADNINTDSDFDVYINQASNKGLLDVNVVSKFTHLNGVDDTRSTRKILILETTPNE